MWGISEEQFIIILSQLMCLSGALTFIFMAGFGWKATYGRYSQKVLVPLFVNAKVAWFVQELPALIVPLLCYWYGARAQMDNITNKLLLAMFVVHYFQRSVIYPFLIKTDKKTPLEPFVAAIAFCAYNGYIQGRHVLEYAVYDEDHMTRWEPFIGLYLFVFGLLVNCHSDHILRNLRKPGDTQYKIPTGGMFDLISGANFFGEILEWVGYALVSQSWPAVAFAFFTICNIGPRALQHHKFYLEKFDDYPKNRKALIPFIL